MTGDVGQLNKMSSTDEKQSSAALMRCYCNSARIKALLVGVILLGFCYSSTIFFIFFFYTIFTLLKLKCVRRVQVNV